MMEVLRKVIVLLTHHYRETMLPHKHRPVLFERHMV
jgi:hypothetical protein